MWTLPSGRNGARGPWTCPVAARPVSATAPAPALGGKGAALAPATSSYGCHHLVGDAIKAAAPRPRRCRVPHVLHSSLPGSLLAKKRTRRARRRSGATVRALLAQRVVVRSARNGNRVEDAASLGRGRSRLERRKTYELTLGATAPTSLYEGWGRPPYFRS